MQSIMRPVNRRTITTYDLATAVKCVVSVDTQRLSKGIVSSS